MPRIEPKTAGWEARTPPLCYTTPLLEKSLGGGVFAKEAEALENGGKVNASQKILGSRPSSAMGVFYSSA